MSQSVAQERKPKDYLVRLVALGDRIEGVQMFIGVFCVVSLLSFATLDVFFRTLNRPIVWAQEVATFSYIWAIFMGSGIAIRRGSHFEIDLLVTLLPGVVKRYLQILKHLFILIFTYLLVGPGLEFAMLGIKRVSNPSGIPLIIPSIAIPFAGLFVAYYLVEAIACYWEGTEVGALSSTGAPE
jgi:TRAP-type C4-dicarboxylate transport system permease small subunit